MKVRNWTAGETATMSVVSFSDTYTQVGPHLDPHGFLQLFEDNPDSLLLWDPHTDQMLEANSAACRILGYPRRTLLALRPSALHREQIAALTVFTQSVLEHGFGWTDELTCRSGERGDLAVEYTAKRLQLNDRLCLLVCLRDLATLRSRQTRSQANEYVRRGLTEWRRVQRLFEDIERENQLILRAAGEGIYGVNHEGVTTFVNPAAERMLGWSADELVGKNMHTLVHHSRLDGAHYPVDGCPIFAAFRDGTTQRGDDEIFWRKDGTPLPISYTSTPIRDRGQLVGAVVLFRDISERKEAEARLQRALTELEGLKRKLEQENAYLQEEIKEEHNHREIVGRSPAVHKVIRQIELVAPTDAAVLITGESGTGKELIARAIHESSRRSDRPLIRVNCASVPRELFESEFFGHVKGAFTGAVRDRLGRFELADGGTLFLDEVGEIPPELQGKLLRVLQEGQFERVGDNRTCEVDVRIIAATNRDLVREVAAGRFREDLYFRLNVFPIHSVPLRQRTEDVALLASHFLARACHKLGRDLQLTQRHVEQLQAYPWPGNVRELENVIERAVIVSSTGRFVLDLPQPQAPDVPAQQPATEGTALQTEQEKKARERESITRALELTGGKVFGPDGAAALLGVKPTTLASRIKRLGIEKPKG